MIAGLLRFVVDLVDRHSDALNGCDAVSMETAVRLVLALALVFVNGLAADARAYDEFFQYHRSTMRKARSFKQGPASARYGNQVAPEMDIVR